MSLNYTRVCTAQRFDYAGRVTQATKKCQDLWYRAEKQEGWECMEEECTAREGCEQMANEQHERKK